MLNTFLLTNRMKESLGGGFYRLLERREVVSVTSRMMDFGKQLRVLKTGNIIRIGFGSMKLSE